MAKISLESIRRKPSLADDVAEDLRRSIKDGKLVPESRLPSGPELAKIYNVSAAVIREAMSQLKRDGLVNSYQGAGSFVASPLDQAIFRLDHNPGDAQTLGRIYELRLALEGHAAHWAAERRTKRQLGLISDALKALDRDGAEPETASSADLRFHLLIAQATNNDILAELYSMVANHLERSIVAARTHSKAYGLSEESRQEHRAIYSAIEGGNPAAAMKAALDHVRRAAQRLGL